MAHTYATPAAVIVVAVLFPVLGIIAVSLRLIIRFKSKMAPWVDDWLVLPALVLECAMAGLMIWGAATRSLGDLLPAPNVPGPMGYLFSDSAQQVRLQQIQYHVDWIGILAFGLLKLSVLFFYRKIFCNGSQSFWTPFNLLTRFMIGLVIVWTVAFGFGAIFLCGSEPDNAWAPVAIVAQRCPAQLQFLEGYAISDFILDCIIWTMPLPKIWALHMPLRRKLQVCAVFLVGILTIAASAARMSIYIVFIVNAFAQSDGETLITYLLFWTMIECGLSVIVVCMPTLRVAVTKAFGRSVLSSIKNALSFRSIHSETELTSMNSNTKDSTFGLAGKESVVEKDDVSARTLVPPRRTSAYDIEGQPTHNDEGREINEVRDN